MGRIGLKFIDYLEFEHLPNGCIVPKNVKLNKDGYYHVHYVEKGKNGKRQHSFLFHKYVWQKKHGLVPEGFCLHHLCHNRACCNPDHLQLISKSEHAKLHNSTRYAERQQKAKEYWLEHKEITGTALGNLFSVCFSVGCRWIRKWKKEVKC